MKLEVTLTKMGRRGVQQLTSAEWREALEQQIREKQQQRGINGGDGGADQLQKRSQSAPQQGEDDGELISSVPGLERAVTTATVGGQMEKNAVAGRRRQFQQQSQDEYFKGLREQIEEKKRLTQLEHDKQQSWRRRMSRSEADDVPGSRRESCEEKGAVEKDCCRTGSPLRDRKENETSITVSNQDEAQLCEAAVSKSGVAADPVVITKIVDFCEELKKQNEDVKKQLLEQHAVLTSLHSTLAVEADGKADVTRRRNVSKSQLKAKPGSKSNFLAKDLNTKPAIITSVMCRPRPARGETKIPLPRSRVGFSLRSAGADIVKGSSPEVSTRSNPEMLRAEAKVDNPTCCDEIPAQTKVAPPDSPHKGLSEELDSQLCETKACSLDTQERTKSQEGKETCALKGQNEKEETDDRHEIHAKSGDDEKPMDTESKFVHHWESQLIGDELLECTSISILDGPSSLVSLDQSFRDLFH